MFTGPVIGRLRSSRVRQVLLDIFFSFFFGIITAMLKAIVEWKTRGLFFLMLNYSNPGASFCFLRPVGELVVINFVGVNVSINDYIGDWMSLVYERVYEEYTAKNFDEKINMLNLLRRKGRYISQKEFKCHCKLLKIDFADKFGRI